MKKWIRETIERKEQERLMAEQPINTGISAEQLQQILTSVLAAAKEMNPLEKKKYDEAVKADKRRSDMMFALGQAEEATRKAKINGCSHSRWPANSGRHAGEAAPRGQGEWVTGGQLHGNDIATLACLRCGHTWAWRTTPQEREYIINQGLLNFAPPTPERELGTCPHCDSVIENVKVHAEVCAKNPANKEPVAV